MSYPYYSKVLFCAHRWKLFLSSGHVLFVQYWGFESYSIATIELFGER